MTIIEAGLSSDAAALLRKGVHLHGSTGKQSNRAALEATTCIYRGDLLSTIFFINKIHPWLDRPTPLKRAEQSEEGLEFVIDIIGAIGAGV
ncbi:hypothetical protein [Pelagerythrobacter sp.]|uniref:hypothetical protein n=1 Tax=Pelagerythrobacter sp. TaxID=2800702 RepID=UPI0035B192F2